MSKSYYLEHFENITISTFVRLCYLMFMCSLLLFISGHFPVRAFVAEQLKVIDLNQHVTQRYTVDVKTSKYIDRQMCFYV